MKKNVLIIAALSVFALSSCVKEWTCDCLTSSPDGFGGTIEFEIDSEITTSKKKAIEHCTELEVAGTEGDAVTTCDLQ
jgi:hypothetical protein